MYKLKNIEVLPGGIYKADLHFDSITKRGKTFFPSSWDHKKLISKINEACHNITDITHKRGNVLEIIGVVSEKFEITIRIDKKGIIKTVYPALKRNKLI